MIAEKMDPTRVTPALQMEEYTASRRVYWESFAREAEKWERMRRYYRRRLEEVFRLGVPAGKRVLELGCGDGSLLASLEPCYGYGLDLSPTLIERARELYPALHLEAGDAMTREIPGTFDFIVLSDILNDVWDVQLLLEKIRRNCHAETKLLINHYSHLWEWPRRLAETLGLAKRMPAQNWIGISDLRALLALSKFEPVRSSAEVLCPVAIPLLAGFCNRFLVKLWPFQYLALTNFLVARPAPVSEGRPEEVVTVVVPARNEAGNIAALLERVPEMGLGTDLIFVEGHSTDQTYEAIVREIAARPGCQARVFQATGKGKGAAVRLGFEKARGGVLMILDADMTVPPEDLERFYRAWQQGTGEFINGVRLVYPMEDGAMRFLNLLGNKFFSMAFTWLLGQDVKDTLCGTKVLSREHYELIAQNRGYFGKLDPFGDFDLIFGAARFNLKIVDMPVRYRERKYGTTNINRWRHGMLLLRMVALAARRVRFV